MAMIPFIGRFRENVTQCTYSEEINSRNPGDYAGATQQATFSLPLTADTYMDMWQGGSLTKDGDTLLESGQITGISDSGVVANYTLAGAFSRLNREGKVPPRNNVLLTAAVNTYILAAGLSMPMPEMVGDFLVTVPGWEGNLWDGLKQLLSAYGCYLYMAQGVPTIRRFDSTDGFVEIPVNLTSKGRSVQGQDTVEWIEVAYYNNEYVTNRQIYPYNIEEPTTYSVGSEETLTYEVQLGASLASVNQPAAVDAINLATIDTVGQYAIVDSAGAPIPAAEWIGQGGLVQVRLKDHQTLEVTIRGMKSSRNNAPFRLAEFDRDAYPALYITGTGVRNNRKVVRLHTGASRAIPDSSTSVDNPFVSTEAQAYTVGQWAATDAAVTQTVDFGGGPERVLLGTKFRTANGVYRVVSTSVSPGSTGLNAVQEVSMKNFADTLGSRTMAQMGSIWGTKSMGLFALEPLRTA